MFTYQREHQLQDTAVAPSTVQPGTDAADFGSNAEQAEALDASPDVVAQDAPAPASIPPFDDGGGYHWQACNDGSFACVETPPGKEKALGTVVTEEGNPEAWALLDQILQARAAEVQPPPPGVEPPTAPPATEEGAIGLIPEVLAAVQEAADSAWEWLDDMLDTDPIGAVKEWWAGEDAAEEEGREAQEQTPAEAEVDDVAARKEAKRQELLDQGVKDNLDVAEDLADDLNVPHGYDDEGKNVAGDITDAGDRRRAIEAGDEDALKSVLCSEFTNLTLADAGWDLTQEFVDPDSGMPVCYLEKNGSVTFVTLFMIVNTQWEATGAALEVQGGLAEEVEGGSDRAKELGEGGRSGSFWYSTAKHFKGMDASSDQEFGAGLAAQALGGDEIDTPDRKPGDLQQWLYVRNGEHKGYGHSSQVWSVKGHGVVYLGGTNSPTLEGGPEGLEPGWYEVDAGSGAKAVLDADTDPAMVATFTTIDAQLIDANQGRGQDATGVGDFDSEEGHSDRILSNGRLPTSKWYPWAPDHSRSGAALGGAPAAQAIDL